MSRHLNLTHILVLAVLNIACASCAVSATDVSDPPSDRQEEVGVATSALLTTGSPIMGLAKKCIDVSASNDRTPAGNRRVILNTCNGSSTQQWTKSFNSQIVNTGTGLCLNAEGAYTANGTNLIAFPCSATAQPNEKWYFTPSAPVMHDQLIKNIGSGRCVNVPRSNSTDGTGLILWDCVGVSNDQWAVRIPAPIVGLAGKCLDVDTFHRTAANNARAVLNTCSGSWNQDWSLNAQDQLVNRGMPGMCLNIEGGGTDNGTPIIVYPCQPTAQHNEVWFNQPNSYPFHSFQLVNTWSGKCLNVPAENRADNTGLILWPCTGSGVSNDTWSLLTTPKQSIKAVAIACSDDDGTNGTTLTVTDFRSVLQEVNGLYERAGIEFIIDDGGFIPYRSTLLNHMNWPPTSAQDQAAKNLAAFFNGAMVVILRNTGNTNFATDYVVLGNTGISSQNAAHEFGHYLGLAHTFPEVNVTSLAAAYKFVSDWYFNHGSTLEAFNADGFTDTPPDPAVSVYALRDLPRGDACSGDDHISVPLSGGGGGYLNFYPDRQQVMSYFGCGLAPRNLTLSAQQIGAILTAIGSGSRTQLVRN
jgi:hypothetical protein